MDDAMREDIKKVLNQAAGWVMEACSGSYEKEQLARIDRVRDFIFQRLNGGAV